MSNIDVFTGGADGLCALHQLRLVYPADATLVTGVRRDTKLLGRVQAKYGDNITVLNISMGENREALQYLLRLGANVRYFDHHYVGPPAKQPGLTAVISADPETCTSALVDRYLGGQYRVWSVVAAFGVNLDRLAMQLAKPLGLSAAKLEQLKELGQCLSYNAYGDQDSDHIIPPAVLYGIISRYDDPFRFMERESAFQELRTRRRADLEAALQVPPDVAGETAALYVLPDNPGSRRVRGELAIHLGGLHPLRAHAVLAPNSRGGYGVSVRQALASDSHIGADEFCRRFGGSGQPAAAGIGDLPQNRLQEFKQAFVAEYQR